MQTRQTVHPKDNTRQVINGETRRNSVGIEEPHGTEVEEKKLKNNFVATLKGKTETETRNENFLQERRDHFAKWIISHTINSSLYSVLMSTLRVYTDTITKKHFETQWILLEEMAVKLLFAATDLFLTANKIFTDLRLEFATGKRRSGCVENCKNCVYIYVRTLV